MAQLRVSDHSAAPYMFLTDFAQVEFDFEQESLFELQPQLIAMTEEEVARFRIGGMRRSPLPIQIDMRVLLEVFDGRGLKKLLLFSRYDLPIVTTEIYL
jgi:hypothetical protein